MDIEKGNEFENGKNKRKYYLIGVAVFLVLLLPVFWYLLGSTNSTVGKANNDSTSATEPPFIPLYKEEKIYVMRLEYVADVLMYNIYSVDLEGGKERRIYPAEGSQHIPFKHVTLKHVSPDGKWVLFSKYDKATKESTTYLIRNDGIELREIGKGEGLFFSPDGKLILLERFLSMDEGSVVEIVDFDGKVIHSWTTLHEPMNFSPDGKTVIISERTSNDFHSVELETGKVVETKLKVPTGTISPDGKKMISISYDGTIPISDPDESNKHLISNSEFKYQKAIWSQDGKSLLACSKEKSTDYYHLQILELNPERTAVVETKNVHRIGPNEQFIW